MARLVVVAALTVHADRTGVDVNEHERFDLVVLWCTAILAGMLLGHWLAL